MNHTSGFIYLFIHRAPGTTCRQSSSSPIIDDCLHKLGEGLICLWISRVFEIYKVCKSCYPHMFYMPHSMKNCFNQVYNIPFFSPSPILLLYILFLCLLDFKEEDVVALLITSIYVWSSGCYTTLVIPYSQQFKLFCLRNSCCTLKRKHSSWLELTGTVIYGQTHKV